MKTKWVTIILSLFLIFLSIDHVGNCVHHDGFVYDISAPHLPQYLPSEASLALHKIECDLINNPQQREELEREKGKYKWICCDATFTAGSGANGCKKGKHNCGEQIEEEQQDRRYLDQNIVKQWEEECRRNQEYNVKWLSLLQQRT